MTMFGIPAGQSYMLNAYCRKCGTEFTCTVMEMSRHGSYCENCRTEDDRRVRFDDRKAERKDC